MSNSLISVQGVTGIRRMLAPFLDPELTKTMQDATAAGAQVLKGPMKSEAAKYSRRMGASVYVHKAKRGRPATVVGHHVRKAFFWHMVVGGTKDHGPRRAPYLMVGLNGQRGAPSSQIRRVKRVKGVAAHPFPDMVAERNKDRVVAAMQTYIAARARS